MYLELKNRIVECFKNQRLMETDKGQGKLHEILRIHQVKIIIIINQGVNELINIGY